MNSLTLPAALSLALACTCGRAADVPAVEIRDAGAAVDVTGLSADALRTPGAAPTGSRTSGPLCSPSTSIRATAPTRRSGRPSSANTASRTASG